MKALILVGGYGTRLRPLSCTRPKFLFPIANQPLLKLTLENLANYGVKESILAVGFMAEKIKQACGESIFGMNLHYSKDNPTDTQKESCIKFLGTGGSIKKAEDFLKDDNPFFVLNGDILSEVDYQILMKKHLESDSVGTVALHRVEDPTRYGIVKVDQEKKILKFVEKPTKRAPSNLANAGIYVFNSRIFKHIPKGKPCSIEREIFPRLVKNKKLDGHEIKGLWMDIGKPRDYIKANALWLNRYSDRLGSEQNRFFRKFIKKPVVIGKAVKIGNGSEIGPNVSVGNDVSIGKSVIIKNTIIFPHTKISDYSEITNAVIGECVTIGKKVVIKNNCLIGDLAEIKENTVLDQNITVCPSKSVSQNTSTSPSII